MIHEFKKVWKPYTIGLLWLLGLLWPLLGIHPDGTLSFGRPLPSGSTSPPARPSACCSTS
jgi:hypothetical protein